jgi:hypothetical protein
VRDRLLTARRLRTIPARDDKVVTGWNGWTVTALAEIGAVHRRPELIDAAVRAGSLLWDVHEGSGRMIRVSRDGRPGAAAGVLEDHAGAAEGFLMLYQATGHEEWMRRAEQVLDVVLTSFGDGEGGFYDTAMDAEPLVRRPQEWTDNATPCGQSALAGALLTAAALGGRADYRAAVERLLTRAWGLAERAPRFAGWWLAVCEAWLDGPREVAVVGVPGADRDALAQAAWSWPGAGRVVAVAEPDLATVGLVKGRAAGTPHAWVCRSFRCERPTDDPGRVVEALRSTGE